ncbi:hydroxymethylglutaryl-CoA lyase [Phenylobacterium sp.]|jgi:hydroxymethylglutaryl-CoA lyase|uniref:hydroxymethylglutaryl-CoA lyase n=1 Tax=Phenylobacterium sp. TaxID=1871053 RepID=UPI0025E7DBC0|nr:hydroxymethylglutaryl-CoA lyase [Phenylobacterium sp.]MCA6286719.1 hydroxymethylglutaryl-CoA lyase [Phenylobacterium sp.]MCA6289302.1 hydroxymethylglutaryl-CoA lyase [Phenylobacterium sp.]MCA6310603.1 hydroxymethylglutaryl-CoA lyase [Phenylobacterium sp.]MCA6324239.1 hydroxymethylglutaryl-CoA lyase [Phenylobacterium sp.]MCA6337844.1 hydroxymethylglutaryl-CoA lyase [Phenylobacterium sp.]
MSRFIEIVEVGPRDGLQNEKTLLTPAQRVELIRRLEAAGARRTETVSFVNPARVPQMAGAEEVCAALPTDAARSRIGLVLNMRGWDRAVSTGCDEANVVVCASNAFGLRNQGSTTAEQMATLAAIAERRAAEGGPRLSVTFSVAFGCPFEGEVAPARVIDLVREAAALPLDEIALADTIGVADPWGVRRLVEACRSEVAGKRLRLHFHDTRNTGLANAFAGIEAGVDVLDASCGGLGGCPFAPNATGNIGTEDLVYMLERAGFETGYDLPALISTAEWVCGLLGKIPTASVTRAGLFPLSA